MASDEPDLAVRTLERDLAARDRTIAALIRRVEGSANEATAFAVMEQNIALERVVLRKTAELQAQHHELETALDQLRQAQAHLVHGQKMEAIGRLASGVAHEINTPMQFVMDNLVFLRREVVVLIDAARDCSRGADEASLAAARDAFGRLASEGLLEEIPASLEDVLQGLGRVTTLVRSLKAFGHPGTGERRPADMREIVATAVDVSRNEWKYVADVTTEFDANMPPVPCRRDELVQVVLNLVVNAAHAIGRSRKGSSDKGSIQIRTFVVDGAAELRVTDDGGGIPACVRDRVFEPFFTTKDVGEGTGQGLAIVYSVVEKHGGTVGFETEEGRGTTFVVRLPLRRQPTSRPPTSAERK